MNTAAAEKIVLVGIDGSESSQNALDWAIQEAKERGWPIRLLSAYTIPSVAAATIDVSYVPFDDEAIRASVEETLTTAAERVRSEGVPVEAVIEVGDPASVLIEESKSACLAVVGTRGRGGIAGRLLGTVSIALPSHSACPTAVIPTDWRPGTHRSPQPSQARCVRTDEGDVAIPEDDGGLDERPGRDYSGAVVVGVDALGRESPALWTAAAYASRHNKPLAILAVMTTTVLGPEWLPSASDLERYLNECAEKLDACRYSLAERYPDLRVSWHLYEGSPSEALVRASDTADVLVVGSRGRGGFAGLLLGSTSQAVLPHSRCPTIVVRIGTELLGEDEEPLQEER
ncbi:universal stress protein [Sediminivirga luteola]|jgi:nucleotide-binding universal stress UspA family protein|uniref:Universal stress protein n=1 Tax=Sediminivirga luteola TaxID=1774748 RepID=A0A8J2TVC4_9MICO|nr:universal stress protein [Sediminivirga luteola]MCI2265936.1 universal stress protein [Sediminivirga luteola]GGA03708.1 universal stress protein [Sediminivirga luteola]